MWLLCRKPNSLEAGNLNKPADIVRVDVVFDGPLCQLVPLVCRSAVYRQPELSVLVLILLQVRHHLLQASEQSDLT